jgi:hypothetical protein
MVKLVEKTHFAKRIDPIEFLTYTNRPGNLGIVALGNLLGQPLDNGLPNVVDGLLSLRHTPSSRLGLARFSSPAGLT